MGNLSRYETAEERVTVADFLELAAQWHPEKNGDLRPEDFSPQSGVKVWWKCPEGSDHVWRSTIRDRTRGRGCGFCAGKRVSVTNCFAVLHPEAARHWHPNKNGNLRPENIVAGSNKRIWWRCKQGHEWQARVEKVSKGHWCPFCAGVRSTKKHNLAVKNPEVIYLWHPTKNGTLKPENFTPKSEKKAWWLCPKGHEWQTQIKNVANGNRCPECAKVERGKKKIGAAVKRWGSLEEKYPELAALWHEDNNVSPSEVSPKSAAKVKWRCTRGHVWKAQVRDRVQGTGCPYCNPQVSLLEVQIFSELKQVFLDAESQFKIKNSKCDIFIPSKWLVIEVDGYPWHMNQLEKDRIKSNKLKKLGYNLIRVRDTKLPKIEDETIPMDSSRRYDIAVIACQVLERLTKNGIHEKGIEQAIDWYRTKGTPRGDEYAMSFIAELNRGNIAEPLSQKYPHLQKEWLTELNSPLELDAFPAGSNMIVWWQCDVGHKWQASIGDRTRRGSGCRRCIQSKQGDRWRNFVLKRKGSLEETHPSLAHEWHPKRNGKLTPSDRTAGSQEKVWWICRKGHEWQATINSRSRGNGCNVCGRKEAGKKRRNSIEKIRETALKRGGKLLSEEYTDSKQKLEWGCKEGHRWFTSYKSIVSGTWCPICARNSSSKS